MTNFEYHHQAEIYQRMIKMKNGSCIIIGTPPRGGKNYIKQLFNDKMRGLNPSFIVYDDLYRNKSKNTLTLKQYKRRYLK